MFLLHLFILTEFTEHLKAGYDLFICLILTKESFGIPSQSQMWLATGSEASEASPIGV